MENENGDIEIFSEITNLLRKYRDKIQKEINSLPLDNEDVPEWIKDQIRSKWMEKFELEAADLIAKMEELFPPSNDEDNSPFGTN